jgi:hypothetical protein
MSIKKKTMDPLITASLIQGASSVGGSIAQGQANASQMAYNDRQYERQRKDALADWTMQNEYNSPKAQMARYKDAGLNPNLIYGKMDNSPAIRSSEMSNAKLAPVNYAGALAEGLQTYQDTALKTAQTDNLKKQNDVLTQDILLKTADVLGKDYANKKMKFEIDNQPELFKTTLDGLKANTRKAIMDTISTGASNMRANQLHDLAMKERKQGLVNIVQDLANKKSVNALTNAQRSEVLQRVKNLKNTNALQQIEKAMKEKGVQPTDNYLMRIGSQLINAQDIQKAKNNIIKWIKGGRRW